MLLCQILQHQTSCTVSLTGGRVLVIGGFETQLLSNSDSVHTVCPVLTPRSTNRRMRPAVMLIETEIRVTIVFVRMASRMAHRPRRPGNTLVTSGWSGGRQEQMIPIFSLIWDHKAMGPLSSA